MEDSREHILKTAYLLFLQKSYKAVTLKELMDKTGFSKGAFYHYFQSKEHVFRAIIDSYFQASIHADFSRFVQNSLRDFMHDYQRHISNASAKFAQLTVGAEEDSNHYSLIFEAIRLLPGFRDSLLKQQQTELVVWTAVVQTAKDNGEIRTPLPSTQVARLFIHTSDGIALQLVINNRIKYMLDDLQEEWDSLYTLLKA